MLPLREELYGNGPAVLPTPGTRTTKEGFVIDRRIPPAGDPFTSAPRRERTSRHIRCTHEFVQLLEEDFGIPHHALVNAFMGMPAEPQKSAIKLCAWAARQDEPAHALLAWARKNRRGTFRRDPEDVSGDEH